MKLINNKRACLPARQGFTLVELLLVMAIIGILAAVIFVMMGPARKKARITTFKQHMKDLAVAGASCIDSDGNIFNGTTSGVTADGSIDVCNGVSGLGQVPLIKTCRGGATPISTLGVTNSQNDDFAITADCPVSNTDHCYAYCTVNGCYFSSTDITNGTNLNNADGCPL